MINIDKARLTKQIQDDEGFVAKAYWDIKQYSNGFGTRALAKDEVITKEVAAHRLNAHIEEAIDNFEKIFKDHLQKFNDVRAEAFINMIFNMGPGVAGKPNLGGFQSFQNTIGHIKDYDVVDWKRVGYNLEQSKWYKQVGDRAVRIVKEITTGTKGA